MATFLIFFDKRFDSTARSEISSTFGVHMEEVPMAQYFGVLIETGASEEDVSDWLSGVQFVHGAVRILSEIHSGGTDIDYAMIESKIEEFADKGKTFMIEVLNLGAGTGMRAKDIEVRLGTDLEKRGFSIDLKKPTRVFYLIFAPRSTMLGTMPCGGEVSLLDSFRRRGTGGKPGVSRASFKLSEAMDYFGIEKNTIRRAIDIGAAPGGWTAELLSMGTKVVAVDSATLDKEGIEARLGRSISISEVDENADILYMKGIAQDVSRELSGLRDYDALMIDINFAPAIAAELAVEFARSLRRGAYLIMTLKLGDNDITGSIDRAKEIIGFAYNRIRLKKLPHNRREITLFAIKDDST